MRVGNNWTTCRLPSWQVVQYLPLKPAACSSVMAMTSCCTRPAVVSQFDTRSRIRAGKVATILFVAALPARMRDRVFYRLTTAGRVQQEVIAMKPKTLKP